MRPARGLAVLRRLGAEGAATAERCEACARPIEESHGHRLSMRTKRLQCVCSGCSAGARDSRNGPGENDDWKSVERRVAAIEGPSAGTWAGVGLPIQLAFFTVTGAPRAPTAFFPGPAGAAAFAVDAAGWQSVCASVPGARAMACDVEALLVNRARGESEQYLVSIDVAYHLVGALRALGRAFGQRVDQEVERFMASLRREARRG